MKQFKENLLKHPLGIVVYDLIYSFWVALIVYLIIAPGGHYILKFDSITMNEIGLFTGIATFIVLVVHFYFRHEWPLEDYLEGEEENEETSKPTSK